MLCENLSASPFYLNAVVVSGLHIVPAVAVGFCERLASLLLLSMASAVLPLAWGQETPVAGVYSHKFLDRQNVAAFATLGALIALDGVHTQLMLDTHRFVEGDPVARPFVSRGWPGQLAGSTLAYGSAVGLSYMLHKTHHHKVERWANWLLVTSEAANDTRNVLLRPPPPQH